MLLHDKLKFYFSTLTPNQMVIVDSYKESNDSLFNYIFMVAIFKETTTIKILDDNKIVLHVYKVKPEQLSKKMKWVLKKFHFSVKSLYYVIDNITKELIYDSVNVKNEVEFSLISRPTLSDEINIIYEIHQENINSQKFIECFNEYIQMIKEETKLNVVCHQPHPISLIRQRKLQSIGLEEMSDGLDF